MGNSKRDSGTMRVRQRYQNASAEAGGLCGGIELNKAPGAARSPILGIAVNGADSAVCGRADGHLYESHDRRAAVAGADVVAAVYGA
jgi:hypothetical protein